MLSEGMKGQLGLFLFLFFPKNFTALIPGTTVEILHGDSKNIIQLIINAYSVSSLLLPCPPSTEALELLWLQMGSTLCLGAWLCTPILCPGSGGP